MNKYGSNLLFLRARNVYEAAISPGTDLVLTAANANPQMLHPTKDYYDLLVNSNVTVKSVGVYSNFADGLVFKNPSERFSAQIAIALATRAAQGGDFTVGVGSKSVTGTGFNALTTGDVVVVTSLPNGYEFYHIADTITDDNNMTIMDYSIRTHAAQPWYKLSMTTVKIFNVIMQDISQLNCQFALDQFIPAASFSINSSTDMILRACLNASSPSGFNPAFAFSAHSTTFLTHSISTDFDGETAHFDVGVEIEYTRG